MLETTGEADGIGLKGIENPWTLILAVTSLMVFAFPVLIPSPALAQTPMSGAACDQYASDVCNEESRTLPETTTDPGQTYETVTEPEDTNLAEPEAAAGMVAPPVLDPPTVPQPSAGMLPRPILESPPEPQPTTEANDTDTLKDAETPSAIEKQPSTDAVPTNDQGEGVAPAKATQAPADTLSPTPIPQFNYEGAFCGSPDKCGLRDAGNQVEFAWDMKCAKFVTENGKNIVGCALLDPLVGPNKPKCYEYYFFYQGEMYKQFDGCRSGTKPSTPPEPPADGNTLYFDPDKLDEPKPWLGDNYPTGAQCNRRGESVTLDGHDAPNDTCGLKNIKPGYSCEVYFGTRYGTVRGCYKDSDLNRDQPRAGGMDVTVYDKDGNKIAKALYFTLIKDKACRDRSKCGVAKKVPPSYRCKTYTYDWGPLYEDRYNTYITCRDPDQRAYERGELPPEPDKVCARLFDERGRLIETQPCMPPGGDGGLVDDAYFYANATKKKLAPPDNTTKNHESRPSTTPAQNTPDSNPDSNTRQIQNAAPQKPPEAWNFDSHRYIQPVHGPRNPVPAGYTAPYRNAGLTDAPRYPAVVYPNTFQLAKPGYQLFSTNETLPRNFAFGAPSDPNPVIPYAGNAARLYAKRPILMTGDSVSTSLLSSYTTSSEGLAPSTALIGYKSNPAPGSKASVPKRPAAAGIVRPDSSTNAEGQSLSDLIIPAIVLAVLGGLVTLRRQWIG